MKYTLIYLFPLLVVSCKAQVESSPCLDRIDYTNVDINEGIDLEALFAPVTDIEKSTVLSQWDTFDMSSSNITIIESYEIQPNRNVNIVQHSAEGRIHYGAIIEPLNYNTNLKYPLMIWAEGLDQNNPLVRVEGGFGGRFTKGIPNHFVLIPSYRGQALKANNQIYCSDGFFGDAFDGATDDALRLLQVALDTYSNAIDEDRLTIYGGSRGGTVALLAGIRYPKFNKVVSQSGPVQFHNVECYDRYRSQFRYQFLSEQKSMEALRIKMIRSSPLYFIEGYKNHLLVVHGRNDSVVPLWNAESIIAVKKGDRRTTHIFTDDGHMVGAAGKVSAWINAE